MQEVLKNTIVKLLRDTANKIDAGNCELTEEEASHILSVFSHNVFSKEQAITYMNVQRSRFDELVRIGCIPRGRKRRGFKELVWYQDELDTAIQKYRTNKIGN